MSTTGEIRTLYSDREQTQAVFPRTKVKAVSDDNGTGLNVLLDDIHAEIDGLTYSDVGAAPDDFGLGYAAVEIVDANAATKNGWYKLTSVNVSTAHVPFQYVLLEVKAYSDRFIVQELYRWTTDAPVMKRVYSDGWGEWEWVNPPMVPGVEYRTTERWNSLPVYTKMVHFGNLPNGTTKEVEVETPGLNQNVRYCLQSTSTYSLKAMENGISEVYINPTKIGITTTIDKSWLYALIQFWYVKG